MNRLILKILPALFLFWPTLQSPAQDLAPGARISLITCGPGDEIYSYFGHSALWVYDPESGIDRMYNYGTFDFNIPNFYWEFTKGRLYYMLSVTRSASFFREYIDEGRFIIEQELNLTEQERDTLFRLLEINYLPDNRHYWYDFFKDNCSTRIRDIVAAATDNRYHWPEEPVNPLTFRQLLKPYVANRHWERLGMFLLLSKGADGKATRSDYMFLPDQLYLSFDQARTTEGRRLVSGESNLYLPERDRLAEKTFNVPLLVFSLFLLLSIWFMVTRRIRGIGAKLFDSFIYLATGSTGLLLAFMWFFTEHWTCRANLELLWVTPLNLILLVLIWLPAARRYLILFSRILMVPAILVLITLPFWQQRVAIEAVIIALLTLTAWYRASGLLKPAGRKP